jgi:predicted AAA+ superfamily ATPase
MTQLNQDRIGQLLEILRDGLGPYVLRALKARNTAGYLQAISEEAHNKRVFANDEEALRSIDVAGWLGLMARAWNEVFRDRLGYSERSYTHELIEVRNKWAHQERFTDEEVRRAADTAVLLLRAVGATAQADRAQTILDELLTLRAQAMAQVAAQQAPSAPAVEVPTQQGLLPWRYVIDPHPDVASGRYAQAEFAADLAQVLQGRATLEYGDPREFFRRTYLTQGLQELLVTGIKRLSGQGGDPVVQLQTNFGGGKTHSMLALYHLFSGQIAFSEVLGSEALRRRLGDIDERLEARRAVIVGTAFSPTEPRRYADCVTRTLWGDIAYQIGGVEAYRAVERADLSGVNPGADPLLQLLEQYGPVLIIIDELVAFARNLYNVSERLPVGSFESVMSFMQSLTEAVKRSSDSMLVIAIPQSEIEIGGEGGRVTVEMLANTIGRLESVWRPITAMESFAIVKRRLFAQEINAQARDAVVDAFCKLYAKNKADFPRSATESAYRKLMEETYPIHPELFERLYEDWSTLERFQRTRGVLRLMAAVIHELWQRNDQSLLIMPSSLPLDSRNVRNEMLRYLPESWAAIVDSDVDGEHSKPYQIDQSVSRLAKHSASRRVARTIFVGSAPSVAGQQVRGIEESHIRLAVMQPSEPIDVFSDALRRMVNQLTYLYTNGSRYWYDTRPTVNRIVQDRLQSVSEEQIYEEAIKRLRSDQQLRTEFSAVVIAPRESSEIADEQRVRLVVMAPQHTHSSRTDRSEALEKAREFLENRGSVARIHRNMLVFVAPDRKIAEDWKQALREYLVWKSVEDEAETLNLDTQQIKQVSGTLERIEKTLEALVQETYSWLIVPTQSEPLSPIRFEAHRINGTGSFIKRAVSKLYQDEFLIRSWSPDDLRTYLDRYLWRDQPHLELKQLWEYLTSYCYLPRLRDSSVLVNAVQQGVASENAFFAYASAISPHGTYRDLTLGSNIFIRLDSGALIVRAEVAQAQLAMRRQAAPSDVAPAARALPSSAPAPIAQSSTARAEAPPERTPIRRRYHGVVSLDPQRASQQMKTILEEIVQHLVNTRDATVKITLAIEAECEEGFDELTVRTVSENSRTLRFTDHAFDV